VVEIDLQREREKEKVSGREKERASGRERERESAEERDGETERCNKTKKKCDTYPLVNFLLKNQLKYLIIAFWLLKK
jgi:hypothetical protein